MNRRECFILMFLLIVAVFGPQPAAAIPESIQPVDVLIDVGHGGIDSGTFYQDIYEKEINLQVGKLLYELMRKKGYQVVLNRDGDYALSDDNTWLKNPSRHKRDLAQRRHLAKVISPQVMVSLHVNHSDNPRKSGALVLYQKNNQSYLLAKLLQEELNNVYQAKTVPQHGRTYYLLRHSICPTVIVEMGFISNPRDRKWLTDPKQQMVIASAIEAAISEYFSLLGRINETYTL